MDDPLSAVDTHVGRHLFRKCIKGINMKNVVVLLINILTSFIGYLKDKTCILITHQIQHLNGVDQIILMDKVNIVYIVFEYF